MIAAYVLIQTEVGTATAVAAALRGLPGAAAAAGVAGPYDVIVRAEARPIDQPGRLAVPDIQAVAAVLGTIARPLSSRSEAGPGGP